MNYKQFPTVSKILRATESEESKAFLKKWAESVGEAKAEQIRQEAFTRGNMIDSNVAEYFVTGNCTNNVLKGYLSQFQILENELDCWSEEHGYWGRFDQKLSKDGRIILNDFKGTGRPKQKQWLGDNPVQLSAYYFALLEQGQQIDYAQLSYVVDGKLEVQKFVFNHNDLKGYFQEFLQRREQYNSIIV